MDSNFIILQECPQVVDVVFLEIADGKMRLPIVTSSMLAPVKSLSQEVRIEVDKLLLNKVTIKTILL